MPVRPDIHTVPTQLERANWWLEGLLVAFAGLCAIQLVQSSQSYAALAVLALIALWAATSDAAVDVRGVGAIAGFLRSLLGGRRPHEWLYVHARYLVLKHWPRPVPLGRGRSFHPRPASRPALSAHLLVFAIEPDVNLSLLDPEPRRARMESLAHRLMGLGARSRILVQARPVRSQERPDWRKPIQISRSFFIEVDGATISDADVADALAGLGWRVRQVNPAALQEPDWPQFVLERDGVLYGPYWMASLLLHRWPRSVPVGWVGQALAIDVPCDVAIEIRPEDPEAVARWLQSRVSELSDEERMAHSANAGRRLAHTDADSQREQLLAATNKTARVAMMLTVRARDRDELRERVATVRNRFGIALADVRPCDGEHDVGRLATEVGGSVRVLRAFKRLDIMSAASCYPLIPVTLNHRRGALVGVTNEGAMGVRIDPFDESLESFGGVIIGKTGAGKSYWIKCLVDALLTRYAYDVVLIEQRRTPEHDVLVQRNEGQYVHWDGDPATLPHSRICGVNLYPPVRDVRTGAQRPGLRAEDRDTAIPALVEWLRGRMRGQPILVIVDEGWAILKNRAGAAFAEEMARTGRGDYVAFYFGTQQIAELLRDGQAVFDNAPVRVLLKQRDNDLDAIVDAAGISHEMRRQLESAERGTAFIDWNGLVVKMRAQATPEGHAWMDTDPRRNGTLDEPIGRVDSVGDEHAPDLDHGPAGVLALVGTPAGVALPPDAEGHAGGDWRRPGPDWPG